MTDKEKIEVFLADGPPFAVVGASANRDKYGNKVLRCYLQNGYQAYPIHPLDNQIEGCRAYPDLTSLPERVLSVSIITPPSVTERIVEECKVIGAINIWMQPGAESAGAIRSAEDNGMRVIANGPCVLVVLGYREI